MIGKVLAIALLVLSLSAVAVINISEEDETEREYQGPIPLGYDEEHFRKTGETRRLLNG